MSEPWLKEIETAFEQRFGLQGVRIDYGPSVIPHQTCLRIHVPTEPTAAMRALAREIEAEHQEFDQVLWVDLRRL